MEKLRKDEIIEKYLMKQNKVNAQKMGKTYE